MPYGQTHTGRHKQAQAPPVCRLLFEVLCLASKDPGVKKMWKYLEQRLYKRRSVNLNAEIGVEIKKGMQLNPNYAAAKFAKDARRKAHRRNFVLQVPGNKADLANLAAPCGFKYRTIFSSGGMHLLGEHSKLDNTP